MFEVMKVSLIISTYNWPEALGICLESILKQSRMPDEIIIADDGSANDTFNLIQAYKTKFPINLNHVWHLDRGFQLSAIRNKAIIVSDFEYIIQIDGDLILHKDFILDHIALAMPGGFVSGSRILLPEVYSKTILSSLSIPSSLSLILNGENKFNGIRWPLLTKVLANKYKRNRPYYVKGCNMAFWKNDLIAVNGYNEEINGWGKEDSELAVRLINSGVKRMFIKFGGICYHLYHKVASRENEENNNSILNEAIDTGKMYANKGISCYRKEDIVKLLLR